jgi:acetyltransferase-like isoleucine patch superfamily enzyme
LATVESADVDPDCVIPESSTVWHLAQIRRGAVLGENVIVGRGAYIGAGVRIGANSKIQNFAMVYEPAELAAGVFIGPGVVLTNDRNPRATTPVGRRKTGRDWELVGVRIGEGASIGARAVCVAPVTIGAWAMVAAGAVVVKDVPPFALVVGVPARHVGWVGRAGFPLEVVAGASDEFSCPETGTRYREIDPDHLIELP